MTSKASLGSRETGILGFLRVAGLIAVLVGAAGSVGLMLYVGRRNESRILLILFALWVLSPFVALVLVHVVSKRWPVHTPTLYSLMLVLTLGTLVLYADVAFWRPRPKPASVFLLVPPASWLVIAIATLISGKRSRRSGRFTGLS